jgi:predicted DNA-binding transcriptional regulator AlpA
VSAEQHEIPDALALVAALLDEVRALRSDQHALAEEARAQAAREGMDSLITASELAAILAVNPRTLRRMAAAGELPKSVSITSKPRWRRSDVAKFIKGLR